MEHPPLRNADASKVNFTSAIVTRWRDSNVYLDLVLALTAKIRKSQDFLAPISGSPADQIFHPLSEIQPQYS